MSGLIRKKTGTEAWETVEDTGSGAGSQTLAQTLALGNDAGAQQIKNLGEGTDPNDAVTKGYVDDAIRVGGPIQFVDATGTVTGTEGGVVTASGAADMNFDATGGLFLVNGLTVYHPDHGWTPPVGDVTDPRIDQIYLALTGNDDSGGMARPAGYTYEYNVGAASPIPVPPGPSDVWGTDYLLIADIGVPANAVRSDACTITDERIVRYFPA